MTVSDKSIRVGLVQQACGSSRDANLAASIAGIRLSLIHISEPTRL